LSILECGNRSIDLAKPCVMGILNVTPDSFSDGGKFNQFDKALYHAEQMIADGVVFIDVGGESTRPGAKTVTVQEELERVIPVIEALAKRFDVLISVDTSTPAVMLAAAQAGAHLLNDVRSLRRAGALQVAAQTKLAVCLMHMIGEPHNMQFAPSYQDVTSEVTDFLVSKVNECLSAGIARNRLLIDPGFGFAKTLQHNLRLFRDLSVLRKVNIPILVGVSRKSMIGGILDNQVDERLFGSIALASLAVFMGAKIIRAHDVKATVDAIKMVQAVQEA